MQKMKKQKGITLIALVITIIVMLILVGVSVTVALNGGLFETAQDATDRTKAERDREYNLSSGRIKVGDIWYDSLEDYEKGIESENQTDTVGGNETGTGYTIGTEVTIGETGENFYIIKHEGTELVLLAKNNIKTTSLKQANGDDITANTVAFASGGTPYWSSVTDTSKYPLNLNEYETCPEGSAIDIAKQYAEETIGNGAIGRLMTLEEVVALGGSTESWSTSACNTNGNGFVNSVDGVTLNYWLGTAQDYGQVMGHGSVFVVWRKRSRLGCHRLHRVLWSPPSYRNL